MPLPHSQGTFISDVASKVMAPPVLRGHLRIMRVSVRAPHAASGADLYVRAEYTSKVGPVEFRTKTCLGGAEAYWEPEWLLPVWDSGLQLVLEVPPPPHPPFTCATHAAPVKSAA